MSAVRGSRDANVLNETGTVRADDEDEGQDISTGTDEQFKPSHGIHYPDEKVNISGLEEFHHQLRGPALARSTDGQTSPC